MTLKNAAVREGFKRRPQRKRGPGKPTSYPWVFRPEGRVAKTLIIMIAEQMMAHATTSTELSRKFRDAGLAEQELYARFVHLCPEFPAEYELVRTEAFTSNIVYDRWHKSGVYTNGEPGKGGKPQRSNEHYLNSRWLRPVVPACEEALRRGTPLSLAKMREMGKL
jgi:hypothetical protein